MISEIKIYFIDRFRYIAMSHDRLRHSKFHHLFRCVHASLEEGLSVRPSVCLSVCRSVMRFFLIAKMKVFLHVCLQEGPGTSQKCRIASL